jgi:DNA-binding CsgD family transcriptional regulator
MPFEQALTLLAYGQFLRRAASRRGAVAALVAARDRFAALDAVPYQERADRELAAAGLSPARRGEGGNHLTSQERAVARLVASGNSNRETAAELVISVKTVEFHLRNVYQKLGIASRGQLRASLDEPPSQGPVLVEVGDGHPGDPRVDRLVRERVRPRRRGRAGHGEPATDLVGAVAGQSSSSSAW